MNAFYKTCLLPRDVPLKQFKYTRSGRTDKGVHASGQVISTLLRTKVIDEDAMHSSVVFTAPEDESPRELDSLRAVKINARPLPDAELDYTAMCNGVLPPDIRVVAAAYVSRDFHARFSTQYRVYKYFFVRDTLDIEAMVRGSTYMVGEHDFRHLCKVDAENVTNFVRTVMSIDISLCKSIGSENVLEHPPSRFDVMECRIVGTAFLWHQVRCMMGVLFMIGRHETDPEIVQNILDPSLTRKPNYVMAPEDGLCLCDCGYSDEIFNVFDGKVADVYRKQWSEIAVKQALLTEMYNRVPVAYRESEKRPTSKKLIINNDNKAKGSGQRKRESSVEESHVVKK